MFPFQTTACASHTLSIEEIRIYIVLFQDRELEDGGIGAYDITFDLYNESLSFHPGQR